MHSAAEGHTNYDNSFPEMEMEKKIRGDDQFGIWIASLKIDTPYFECSLEIYEYYCDFQENMNNNILEQNGFATQ